MWCGCCYTSRNEPTFHIRSKPLDKDKDVRFECTWNETWDETEYKTARDGDHLLTPFECERCIFLKLKGRVPVEGSDKDKLLFACIRIFVFSHGS